MSERDGRGTELWDTLKPLFGSHWFLALLPVVCLTVVDFPKPSGEPSQSRRLILAGEGLKDDQIHAKHIGLSGGPQKAQHQAERTTLGSSW